MFTKKGKKKKRDCFYLGSIAVIYTHHLSITTCTQVNLRVKLTENVSGKIPVNFDWKLYIYIYIYIYICVCTHMYVSINNFFFERT